MIFTNFKEKFEDERRIAVLFYSSVFVWKYLYPGKDAVRVNNSNEQCFRTWMHAAFFGHTVLLEWLL